MDPVATSGVVSILTSMGLPGLIIGVLGFAVYKLYGRLNDLQDKRIEESREAITTLNTVTTALGKLSDIIEKRNGG